VRGTQKNYPKNSDRVITHCRYTTYILCTRLYVCVCVYILNSRIYNDIPTAWVRRVSIRSRIIIYIYNLYRLWRRRPRAGRDRENRSSRRHDTAMYIMTCKIICLRTSTYTHIVHIYNMYTSNGGKRLAYVHTPWSYRSIEIVAGRSSVFFSQRSSPNARRVLSILNRKIRVLPRRFKILHAPNAIYGVVETGVDGPWQRLRRWRRILIKINNRFTYISLLYSVVRLRRLQIALKIVFYTSAK